MMVNYVPFENDVSMTNPRTCEKTATWSKNNVPINAHDSATESTTTSNEKSQEFDKLMHPLLWKSSSHEENQYLNMLRLVLEYGETRPDRTGTGTRSVFSPPAMRFSLKDNTLPLLTTKRTFLRGIAEELFWFIRGDTDGLALRARGVKIWDGNGTKEFLEKRGLGHRREGDLGPVYGWQWRRFGKEYVDLPPIDAGEQSGVAEKLTGVYQGVDQLRDVVRMIIEDPASRRIIMTAWNPKDLPLMALPPCHMFVQFYVSGIADETKKPKLSAHLHQRSADLGLGVPFNIASYSLLLHLMALATDTEAGDFVHTIGDAHIYLDHVEPLKTQVEREPFEFPKLNVKKDAPKPEATIDERVKWLESIQWEDIEVLGYKSHGKIEMKMSA